MRFILLVILLCPLSIGCRSDHRCQRQTAMLRAELIDREDQFDILESKYEAVMSELYAYRGDSGEIIGPTVILDGYPDDGPSIQYAPSSGDSGSGLDETILELSEPIPDSDSPSPSKRIPGNPISFRSGQPAEISLITINQRATRGHDVDGTLGDEGIDLLVQTRSADGAIILQSGELTVSVIDPAETPDRQRIGFWKFLPEETELFFANHELGSRGILLHLPWDQSTPTHAHLTIHVRFVTTDGRTLKTSSEIRITPPKDGYSAENALVTRWTQRDKRWGGSGQSSQAQPSWRPVR